MKNQHQRNAAALTLIEVLAMIVIIIILAGLLLPSLANRNRKSPRTKCLSNLRIIGLSYQMWMTDHGGKFPMEISAADGGTLEFSNSAAAFLAYQVMSNIMNDPKILHCPCDIQRGEATNFSNDYKINHISYFVGLNASASRPAGFLSGDRNITNGLSSRPHILLLTANQSLGWTSDIHNNCGNVGFADASVQRVNSPKLLQLLQNSGAATNRLAIP